ncbi:MAG: hypothetical protein QXM52_01080 [Candidatus Bathyarchaeia archaeon]
MTNQLTAFRILEKHHYDPLATPRESPYLQLEDEYPLVLTTWARLLEYTPTCKGAIPELRARVQNLSPKFTQAQLQSMASLTER